MTQSGIRYVMGWLIGFAILCCAGQALADAAPDPLHKGLTPARKSSRIRMVSERVDIYLGRERCDFEVSFTMRNPTTDAESLEVGFPTSYENEVRDPIVHIDGRRVETRPGIEKEIERIEFEGKTYSKIHATYWILWDMHLAPEETQILTMRYWVKPAFLSDYIVTPYTGYVHAIKDEFRHAGTPMPPEVSRLVTAVKAYATGYILKTGSGWNDIIDHAVIAVHHRERGIGVLRRFHPEETVTFTEDSMTWNLSFFEPDFDISIEFSGNLTVDEEIALVDAAITAAGPGKALRKFRDYLATLQGMMQAGDR